MKHRQNSHPIIYCPMSEGVSEQVSAAEGASEAILALLSSRWLSIMFLVLFCFISVEICESQLVCDGRTDRRIDEHTLLWRSENASKKEMEIDLRTTIKTSEPGI